ncbi:M23 family metallopeptidase [Candidatus Fermentibacterales bacterium]|nr:M23 family metallopeptidase [Candidatus Fermentibacterales bacterium]
MALCAVLAGALSVLGCGGGSQEGEIVMRAEDFERGGVRSGDSLALLAADAGPVSPVADTAGICPDSMAPSDTTLSDTSSVTADTLPRAEDIRLPHSDVLALEIRGSLYTSLACSACSTDADVLGAHCSRAMWWDLDPWSDLIAGDSLFLVLGEPGETGRENRILALRYVPVPGSSNHPFSVYLYLKDGDNFPSFFYGDGQEATPLLSSMPLSTFEEVTGVYGEPRGSHVHQGVDFKAPVGTPVRTTRGGTVLEIDWNTQYNGHCVRLDIGGGYREIFVHLDQVDPSISTGQRLEAGTVIGTVGSTGRSTSPHLHYQIDDSQSGYSIDPYIFLGHQRRRLTGPELSDFQARAEILDGLMSGVTEAE